MLHTARPADNDSVGCASGAKAKDNARVSEPEVFRASFGGSKFMQEDWNRRVSDMQKNGGPDAAAITGRARFEFDMYEGVAWPLSALQDAEAAALGCRDEVEEAVVVDIGDTETSELRPLTVTDRLLDGWQAPNVSGHGAVSFTPLLAHFGTLGRGHLNIARYIKRYRGPCAGLALVAKDEARIVAGDQEVIYSSAIKVHDAERATAARLR